MRILRKYSNRRLYDTSRSCYVTLEDVKQLVLTSEPFQVVDSKTGQDLTRNILMQIISEQEADGHTTILTNQVLQQLIRFYGDSMHSVLSQYIEQSISSFLEHQELLREQMQQMSPLSMMNHVVDQNMNFWKMLSSSQDPLAWQKMMSEQFKKMENAVTPVAPSGSDKKKT